MMIGILKAILSKLLVKQPNCLICVAPNDKLDYYSWKNFKHLIIYTSSPGLFAFHTSVNVDEERSCLCIKAVSLFHSVLSQDAAALGKSQPSAEAG